MSESYAELLELGQQFEDHVNEWLWEEGIGFQNFRSKKYQFDKGENTARIEVKFDRRFEETGNLCFETEEVGTNSGEWHSSALSRGQCMLFAIGNYGTLYLFGANRLKDLFARFERDPECAVNCGARAYETSTSRGWLLPESTANKLAINVFYKPLNGGENAN